MGPKRVARVVNVSYVSHSYRIPGCPFGAQNGQKCYQKSSSILGRFFDQFWTPKVSKMGAQSGTKVGTKSTSMIKQVDPKTGTDF